MLLWSTLMEVTKVSLKYNFNKDIKLTFIKRKK